MRQEIPVIPVILGEPEILVVAEGVLQVVVYLKQILATRLALKTEALEGEELLAGQFLVMELLEALEMLEAMEMLGLLGIREQRHLFPAQTLLVVRVGMQVQEVMGVREVLGEMVEQLETLLYNNLRQLM